MMRFSQTQKLVFTLISLIAVVMVFFFCDSFKQTAHVQSTETENHEHHQGISLTVPQDVSTTRFIADVLNMDVSSWFANELSSFAFLSVLLMGIALSLRRLIPKLCNYILESLRRGILQPKKYNLAF